MNPKKFEEYRKNLEKLPVDSGTDYEKLKRMLDSFRAYFDKHTNNGRHWKRDATTQMMLESGVFQTFSHLLKGMCVTVNRNPKTNCNNVDSAKIHNIISTLLSILGNFFSAGGTQKSQVAHWEIHLLDVLHQILRSDVITSNAPIIAQSLRLLANLIKRGIDPQIAYRTGLLESILATVSKISKFATEDIDIAQNVLKHFLRCIRACLSNSDVKVKVNSLLGLQIIASPLTWTENQIADIHKLDILTIIETLVSQKLSSVPREGILRLRGADGKVLVNNIVNLYRGSKVDTEYYNLTTNILRNFLTSQVLSSVLLESDLIDAINDKVSSCTTTSEIAYPLQLLQSLVEANNNWPALNLCFVPKFGILCGSLVKVFRMKALEQFHPMIWHIYVQVPNSSLLIVIQQGLMVEIRRYLQDTTGESSYIELEKSIICAASHSDLISESFNSAFTTLTDVPPKQEKGIVTSFRNNSEYSHSVDASIAKTSAVVPPSLYNSFHACSRTYSGIQSRPHLDGKHLQEEGRRDGPPPKKILKSEPASRQPTPTISSVKNMKILHRILQLVKRLLDIQKLKAEIASLMPTFLRLLFDIGIYTDITCNFGWDLQTGSLHRISITKNSEHLPDTEVFADLNFIIANLCQDEGLFSIFVTQKLPSFFHMMKFASSSNTSLTKNMSTFIKNLSGLNPVKESTLIRNLSSSSATQRLESAISLPILFQASSTTPRCWFSPCSEVLISTMEDEAKKELKNRNVPKSIIFSLLKMGRGLHFEWKRLSETSRYNCLLRVSSTPRFLLKRASDSSVCLNMEGDTEFHVEAEAFMKASPVFEAMLGGNLKEAIDRRVEFPEFTKDGFLAFLQHLIPETTENPESDLLDTQTTYSVDILFEIVCLTHRYITPNLYTKTINTILGNRLHPSTFMNIYITAAEYPNFPCDIIPGLDLTIRNMTLLYFLTTREIHDFTKAAILEELYTYDAEIVISDLRDIFARCRDINRVWG